MAKITHNISNPNDDLGDQLRTAFGNQNTMNTELYDTKVSTVGGKDLSTNDFTNTLKTKLDGIEAGAEVNIQMDFEQNDNTAKDYIKNRPAQMYTSVGSFHYVDLATQTTPISVTGSVDELITNDASDTSTSVLNAPYGITSMWDTTLNQLDFTQTSVGDLVTVIPAIEVTTTVVYQNVIIYINLGIGSSNPITKQVFNTPIKDIGSVILNPTSDFVIDSLDIKDYPAEIFILSDDDCTVVSGNLDIKVVRKDINVVVVTNDDTKVDKVTGKSLIDDTEITRLSTVVNYDNTANETALDTKQNQLTAGTNITIDVTDPLNPVISASGGGGASISDTAYDATSWNGVTTIAPSKNAIRDKIEALDSAKQDTLGFTPYNATNPAGYISSYTETDPIVKAINGIVKSDGTTIAAAVAGTDYLTPTGSASGLTSFPTLNQNTTGTAGGLSANITQSQVTNLTTDLATKEPTITAGTTGQYWRGDKTWQTLPSSSSITYDTYFVNTSTGNNSTAVKGDANLPYATIDYITALGGYVGGVIVLQNAGTFAINNTIPNYDIAIRSNQACTLDFAGNSNTNLLTAGTSKNYEINLPFGIITNNKSGASGATFNSSATGSIIIVAKELYSYQSNTFIGSFSTTNFNVKKVSGGVSVLGTNDSSTVRKCNDINIEEFICLSSNSCLIQGVANPIAINIGLISGTGSYRFYGGKYTIGDITTTGTSNTYGGNSYLHINFRNSRITSSGGIDLGNGNNSTTGIIFTGNIASSTSINATAVTNVGYNSYFTKFINFSANFGTGTYNQNHGNVYFENCSIKSTNSPITLGGSATYSSSVVIKNSSFEVVNSVALIAGGASSSDTVSINGLTTNATTVATNAGAGITVSYIGKQSIATGVDANDAVTKAQLDTKVSAQTGQIILTSGTSYTLPSTITTATVFNIELVGAGGGGAGSPTTSAHGSGGGGGGYLFKRLTGFSPGGTLTYTIGTAGGGGAYQTDGTAGTSTTLTAFSVTYTASGGGYGIATIGTKGGVGGTGTASGGTVDIAISGQNGADSMGVSSTGVSSAAGGSSGKGWGLGGQPVLTNSNGNAGTGYGGGGSSSKGSSGSPAGGAGTGGIIMITWFN